MVAHFLITGYLFALSLIGVDPVPYRLPYPGRLLLLIGIMAMHAFFGIALMMQTGLMVSEWFGAMGRTWGATPLEDQYIGGGVAWSIGEIPTLILAITVAIQWSRTDARQQRRRDRQVDRSGDAELEAYNARLAELAERDARAGAERSIRHRSLGVGRDRESASGGSRIGCVPSASPEASSSHFVPSRSVRSDPGELVDRRADGRCEAVGREAVAHAVLRAGCRSPGPSSRR